MSVKIIRNRERVFVEDFNIEFDLGNGGGFSFPCNAKGELLEGLSDEAKENYRKCIEHPERFVNGPELRKNSWSYVEPALAECICGERFELTDEYMGARECPKCERWYNLFGQELVKPEYWEEDNSYDY